MQINFFFCLLHFLRIRFSPYAFHQHQQLIILTLGKIYWRIFAHKIKNAIFLKDCISWFPQKENYPRPKVVVVKQSYDKEKVKDWIPFFFFFSLFWGWKTFHAHLHVTWPRRCASYWVTLVTANVENFFPLFGLSPKSSFSFRQVPSHFRKH